MPPFGSTIGANLLLAALPQREHRQFLAACRPIELTFADVLVGAGERIRHVYFPTVGSISQTTPANGTANLDVGLIGHEGMLGVSLMLGIDVSPMHAVVQGEGSAMRMDVGPFRRQLETSPALLHLLMRYCYVVMGQLAQTAACTRFHVVEARLARLLLMTEDRAHADTIHATHETLARRLGVRRAGVTIAASSLQRRGFIHYRRGDIRILDHSALERAACECYEADNQLYARMLGSGKRSSRGVGGGGNGPARVARV